MNSKYSTSYKCDAPILTSPHRLCFICPCYDVSELAPRYSWPTQSVLTSGDNPVSYVVQFHWYNSCILGLFYPLTEWLSPSVLQTHCELKLHTSVMPSFIATPFSYLCKGNQNTFESFLSRLAQHWIKVLGSAKMEHRIAPFKGIKKNNIW